MTDETLEGAEQAPSSEPQEAAAGKAKPERKSTRKKAATADFLGRESAEGQDFLGRTV